MPTDPEARSRPTRLQWAALAPRHAFTEVHVSLVSPMSQPMARASSGAAELARAMPTMGANAINTATTSPSVAPVARAVVTLH